jgi:hypothetical protein
MTATSYEMPETDWIEVQALPGNNVCVDCGVDSPDWASVTHGVLLCLQCSGPHRYVHWIVGMFRRVSEWVFVCLSVFLSLL